MNIVRRAASRVRIVIMVILAALFAVVARASATPSTPDTDLAAAVDEMTATLKVNGFYVAVTVIGVAILIWLFFWAFGKLKKTAGR